jgi:hypothetical protein
VANAHRFVTVGGYAMVAVDAPQPRRSTEKTRRSRITSDNRARMMAGEDVASHRYPAHVAGAADRSGTARP